MEKILTVSVAAYNGEAYLATALDSCVSVNREILEVIIVDDGSTDATPIIAQRYVDRYPGVFRLIRKENGGYGSTINASLENATGKYFRTLDCDDWFSEGSLAKFLEYLQSCDADAVLTNYSTVRDGKVDYTYNVCHSRKPDETYDFETVPEVCMEPHALTFRTEMLRGAGLSILPHCYYTDMEYTFFSMAATRTLRFCPVELYNYRLGRSGQSVSLENYQKHTQDFILVAERILCQADTLLPTGGAKAEALRKRACDIALFQLENFLLFPTSDTVKAQLVAYDKRLRSDHPSIYRQIRRKNITLLRMSHYLLYRPLSWYARSKGADDEDRQTLSPKNA